MSIYNYNKACLKVIYNLKGAEKSTIMLNCLFWLKAKLHIYSETIVYAVYYAILYIESLFTNSN